MQQYRTSHFRWMQTSADPNRKKVRSYSLRISTANLLIVILAFLCFWFPRFTTLGVFFALVAIVALGAAAVAAIRDLLTPGARLSFLGAIPLSLPVLFLFAMMLQWEGPVFFSVTQTEPPTIRVIGLSMFNGLWIYGPEHNKAEWNSDDIGVLWSFTWDKQKPCCPLERKFRYGEIPPGYEQIFPQHSVTPTERPAPLDPNQTYLVVIERGMGGYQYLRLHGTRVEESNNREFGPDVCWGPLSVGRRNPATVRVDCQTQRPLPMSQRAQARLQAYKEGKLDWY